MGWNYYEYTDEDLALPDFRGIFCPKCSQEIGYEECYECNEKENE